MVSFVQVHRAATQSVAANAGVPLSFDTEDSDADGFWSSGDPTRIIVPTGHGGIYLPWANADFSKVADATRRLIGFEVNGAPPIHWQDSRPGINSAVLDTLVATSGPIRFADHDALQVIVEHDSPSAPRSVSGTFSMLGPLGESLAVCWLRRTVNQSIPAGAATAVQWDLDPIEDNYGMFNPFSSPSKIEVNGTFAQFYVFLCWGAAEFEHVAESTRRLIGFRHNNAGETLWQDSRSEINSATFDTQLRTNGPVRAQANDALELVVEHESGGPRNLVAAEFFAVGLSIPAP